jgi:hypothetical protein
VFLLDAGGEWRFNYLLTSDGAVIGSPESFARRKARRLELTAGGKVFLSAAGIKESREDGRS